MAEIKVADEWKDYEMILTGDGQKLERWGEYLLKRPEPQAIWPVKSWPKCDAEYHRSDKGGGTWEFLKSIPAKWTVNYRQLKFNVEPMGFKHTGLFPEQAVNWDFMIDKIKKEKREINVLNLFAYTGGATVACAYANAKVCHVDAAKGMVNKAKENLYLSNLKDKNVRFIVDDVIKFVKREIRRESRYDAIIMDPPSYGRGPNGELWKLEDELFDLITLCMQLLSDQPLFFMVNSYTNTLSPMLVENILNMTLNNQFKGKVSSYEVGLPVKNQSVIMPCGTTGRWEND
ncbi:MAG: class I SAM-dependent methyltransferase [Clostridia bacterium]|nr:class I SAM-dependent methyltransferase [Clostridia bacterium]